ncbi:MAG: SsrA-binding protein, partial [Bacilli bacterium]|nr:SsrA-binding protein [Bacilli bacterium]
MSRQKDNSLLLENRKAHFLYFLSDFMVAGLVLTGTEI